MGRTNVALGYWGLLETTQKRKKEKHIKAENCKTIKMIKFPHPCYQNPNTVVTSGAYRDFAAIRDQWRCRIAAQVRERQEERKPK